MGHTLLGEGEMKGAITLTLFLMLALLMPPIAHGEEDAAWQHIGHANEVVAMAAMHGKLFAATQYNRLWVREPVPQDIRWQPLGSANRVGALAGSAGNLFGVTMDHKLWMREASAEDAPWHHIGYADGVVAMTALGGKLYAATRGNKFLVCDIAPWNIRWQRAGDATDVMALASLDGKLLAVTKDHKLWIREPAGANASWQYLGEGKPIVALAGSGGKLFAATKDNKLWMRTPPEALQLVGMSLEAPSWLRPPDGALRAVVSMTFNRAIRPSTLTVPRTLKIDVRALTSRRVATGVDGTFQYSEDARTAVFTSERTLEELVRPQPDEVIEYRIALMVPEIGASVSSSVGRSSGGRRIDEQGKGPDVRVLRQPYVRSQPRSQPSEGRVF